MKMLIMVVMLFVILVPVGATEYQYVDLGRGEATAINDLNWMTGCRYDETGNFHPYFWTEDTGFQDLIVSGSGIGRDINNAGEIIGYGTGGGIYWSVMDNTWRYFNGTDGSPAPLAINDIGQIVGYVKHPGTIYDSVIWNTLDSPQILDDFGGEASWAYDINEDGVVVGELKMSSSNNLAYMWTPDGGTQTLSGISHVSTAQSINDLGQIAGSFFTPGESHDFFIWQNGVIQYLSDNYDCSISRINNNGVVVGRLVMPSGIHHAFYWTDGEGLVDLTPTSLYNCAATDINDNGYITGIVYDEYGHNNIALWKPVDMPTYSISGTVTLQNYIGNVSTIPINAQLRIGGTITPITIALQNNGSYLLTDIDIGLYDISFKASHWLRKTITNVAVYEDTTVNVSLINGDVDGDNDVDLRDLNLLAKAIGSRPNTHRWNPNADLNGDNKVNVKDIKILRNNLGLVGDE